MNMRLLLEGNPTEEPVEYFKWAFNGQPNHKFADPELCGKWLVFVPRGEVDDMWRRIREATVAGKLGCTSKVSTARGYDQRVRNGYEDPNYVICVYVYDSTDTVEKQRVYDALIAMGITPEQYKTDEETRRGTYYG